MVGVVSDMVERGRRKSRSPVFRGVSSHGIRAEGFP